MKEDMKEVCASVSDTLHTKEVYASVSDTLGTKEVYASPVLDTLAGIKRGILPEDLDTATQTIEYLAESTKIAIPSMAMLLSHARRHFDDAQEWVKWATACSGLEGDDLHHRRAIGDVLLAYRTAPCFQLLFSLDLQKLLALYRIHKTAANALLPFVTRYTKLATMSRDEVRAAVAEWLGEAKGHTQLTIPGIDRFFADLSSASDETIATMVSTHSQASSASLAARRLVDAAKVYYGSNADLTSMLALKSQLSEMLAELDSDITSLTENI